MFCISSYYTDYWVSSNIWPLNQTGRAEWEYNPFPFVILSLILSSFCKNHCPNKGQVYMALMVNVIFMNPKLESIIFTEYRNLQMKMN